MPNEPKTYYIGIYISDDSKSRKECNHTAIFGELNNQSGDSGNFDWKYVTLECPICGFSHQFKRQLWWEEIKLD